MTQSGKRLVGPLLACCASGLLLALALGLAPGSEAQGSNTAALVSELGLPPPAPVIRFDMPALASFAEVATRPLFNENRRPPAPTSQLREPSAPSRFDEIVLVGIVAEQQTRWALVRLGQSKEMRRIEEGDQISAFRVARIAKDRVLLAGDRDIEVKLHPNLPDQATDFGSLSDGTHAAAADAALPAFDDRRVSRGKRAGHGAVQQR